MTITQHASHCIDLHCHSTASDGALSPAALVERAAEKGVTHLALTDHDTLDGIAEARVAARKANICLISGIELSCVWRKHTIHIVGLDMDLNDEAFRARVAGQQANRWKRASRIAEKLAQHVNGCDKGIPSHRAGRRGRAVPISPGRWWKRSW